MQRHGSSTCACWTGGGSMQRQFVAQGTLCLPQSRHHAIATGTCSTATCRHMLLIGLRHLGQEDGAANLSSAAVLRAEAEQGVGRLGPLQQQHHTPVEPTQRLQHHVEGLCGCPAPGAELHTPGKQNRLCTESFLVTVSWQWHVDPTCCVMWGAGCGQGATPGRGHHSTEAPWRCAAVQCRAVQRKEGRYCAWSAGGAPFVVHCCWTCPCCGAAVQGACFPSCTGM